MNQANIRLIQPKDNQAVKQLVLDTLREFGLHGAGFAGVDAELDDMHQAYDNESSAYYVIETDGQVQGVGGFAPLEGAAGEAIAELRKMYLSPVLRGQGMGQKLIELCIADATDKGFEKMYLETVPAMEAAQALYQKNGFEYLTERLGDTGHHNCHVCMVKTLHG